MNIIQNHPRSFSSVSLSSTLLLIGYITGNHGTGNKGVAVCFDGVTTKVYAICARSLSNTTDLEVGYDLIFEFPAGIKFDKIEITSSSNNGFLAPAGSVNLEFQGYDGSWNSLGFTGSFVDVTVETTKTITASDQATSFTRFKVLCSSATSGVKFIADLKLFEVTAGLVSLNFIDNANISLAQDQAFGRLDQIVDGVFDPSNSNAFASVASTSDLIIPIPFKTPSPIDKFVINGSSSAGFFSGGDPTDCQIDGEGWNGSSWIALGNTGIFTDGVSLTKTIQSTDKVTVFQKARIILSSATSAQRFIGELEIYVLV